jgi:hypothetical protein
MKQEIGTCDDEPHYHCAECGCEAFYVEEIGYGVHVTFVLDDDHHADDKIDEDRDSGAWSEWRGPRRWYVRCSDCDREIEFGWSHPGRAGRFWPVEAACFNPWKSWPEPRYRKVWKARGWLRPN